MGGHFQGQRADEHRNIHVRLPRYVRDNFGDVRSMVYFGPVRISSFDLCVSVFRAWGCLVKKPLLGKAFVAPVLVSGAHTGGVSGCAQQSSCLVHSRVLLISIPLQVAFGSPVMVNVGAGIP